MSTTIQVWALMNRFHYRTDSLSLSNKTNFCLKNIYVNELKINWDHVTVTKNTFMGFTPCANTMTLILA